MRDEHRFREKIELSLEKRQVASIGIAISLFLATAFSLGVLVGKRLASRATVPGPVDDLAALDAQQGPGQGRPSPPPGRVELARPGTGTGSPRAGDALRVADLALAPAAPAARGETTPPGTGTGPAVRSIPRPPEATTIPPGRRTADIAPPQTAILPAPPTNLGKYTVQIGATQDRAEAHQMVVRASKAGLRPYVMEAKLPGRGLWYRVRVGVFADRAAADQYRRDVEREMRTSAVVMPSR